MISIAICDDETYFRNEIKRLTHNYLKRNNYIYEIIEYESGTELLASRVQFDILFLDIGMEGTSGFEAAKKIRSTNKNVKIIFITNFPNYHKQALLVRAFAYLNKPLNKDEFDKTLRDAIVYYKKNNNSINFEICTDDGKLVFDLNSIKYFVFSNRKVEIVTSNKVFYTNTTIKKLSEQLKDYNFFSPHKAYLINLKYVFSNSYNQITLTDNSKIPLSQKRSSEFKSYLSEFIVNSRINGANNEL